MMSDETPYERLSGSRPPSTRLHGRVSVDRGGQKCCFRFQKDSLKNQREHILMKVANRAQRIIERQRDGGATEQSADARVTMV